MEENDSSIENRLTDRTILYTVSIGEISVKVSMYDWPIGLIVRSLARRCLLLERVEKSKRAIKHADNRAVACVTIVNLIWFRPADRRCSFGSVHKGSVWLLAR